MVVRRTQAKKEDTGKAKKEDKRGQEEDKGTTATNNTNNNRLEGIGAKTLKNDVIYDHSFMGTVVCIRNSC